MTHQVGSPGNPYGYGSSVHNTSGTKVGGHATETTNDPQSKQKRFKAFNWIIVVGLGVVFAVIYFVVNMLSQG